MPDNVTPNKEVIISFEKQLAKLVKESKETKLTYEILDKSFDYTINNLRKANLINNTTFDIYQGKPVVGAAPYLNYDLFANPNIQTWQKFYNFNRKMMIDSTLEFIEKNLKKASFKDKLYYSFAKLFDQLDLHTLSDHCIKKIEIKTSKS
jgi:hypothetical protein